MLHLKTPHRLASSAKNIATSNKNHPFGFTLVELLIVIVVIGILAGIITLAYNGIQHRAHGARASAIVDSYTKIFEMYKADNGHYPFDGEDEGYTSCLGRENDYPAEGGLAAGVCGYSYSPEGVVLHSVDSALTDLLRPYVDSLPAADLPIVAGTERGVQYTVTNGLNSEREYRPGLMYALNENEDCARGVGLTVDMNGVNATACYVPLGWPASQVVFSGAP